VAFSGILRWRFAAENQSLLTTQQLMLLNIYVTVFARWIHFTLKILFSSLCVNVAQCKKECIASYQSKLSCLNAGQIVTKLDSTDNPNTTCLQEPSDDQTANDVDLRSAAASAAGRSFNVTPARKRAATSDNSLHLRSAAKSMRLSGKDA